MCLSLLGDDGTELNRSVLVQNRLSQLSSVQETLTAVCTVLGDGDRGQWLGRQTLS